MTAIAAHTDQHEARAAAWHGLQPSVGSTCPRSLAGRRCRLPDGEVCICGRRALDHLRRWRHTDGHTVLTAEPYEVDGHDLAELVADLAKLGLGCRLDGRSPWNPGGTFLLVIEARGFVPCAEPGAGWTFPPPQPRAPAHCITCNVELSAERAGRNTRCGPCWTELLANQPPEATP